jgi:hypothetical protein
LTGINLRLLRLSSGFELAPFLQKEEKDSGYKKQQQYDIGD